MSAARAVGIIAIACPAAPTLAQATFTGLGFPPGAFASEGWAIAGDGLSVCGEFYASASGPRAMRWTPASGTEDLGALPGFEYARCFGLSADGSVIVGGSRLGSGYLAFRWRAGTGIQPLPVLPGYPNAAAYGVSSDGLVVVGVVATAQDQGLAVRWGPGGAEALDVPSASLASVAYSASADGVVISGAIRDSSGMYRACRWVAGQYELLDPHPTPPPRSPTRSAATAR